MIVDSNGYFYEINNSAYLNSYKSNCFCCMPPEDAVCGATNLSYRKALMATIGEGFERQVLFKSYPIITNGYHVWDLIENKEKLLPEFSDLALYFYDTCGLSSHRNSSSCLFNSLSEFIERQSFILTYLAKMSAPEIVHDSTFNSEIPDFLRNIHVYNISILKSFKVYFGLGYVDHDYFAIGIGSGNSTAIALNNLVRELLPLRKVKLNKSNKTITNSSDYQDIFNLLDSNTVMKAYSFLSKDNLKETLHTDCYFNYQDILNEMVNKWDMHPYAVSFLDSNYQYSRCANAKNCKVFDLKYFPSLSVRHFTKKIYDNVEKKTGLVLDRNINFIPFP